MSFPCLTILMAFIIFMAVYLRVQNHKKNANSKQFWETEAEANDTRKQSLEQLAFLNIPLDRLPILNTEDSDILECQNAIEQLATKKILNLGAYTNTDLKLKYGAPNLEILSTYDQNFTVLARDLFHWAEVLHEKGFIKEAITVLEFGVACKTDISGHYILLAQLYQYNQDQRKLQQLIETADKTLTGIMKPTILKKLNEISESFHDLG